MENSTQYHYGAGDNVIGDKLVYNIENTNLYNTSSTIIPENLKIPIQEIFTLVSNRNTTDAREKIKFIAQIKNLSEDVNSLLHLIGLRCSILEDANIHVDLGSLQRIITSSNDPMITDFAISLVLRASLMQEGEIEARSRLEAYTISGNYSKAVAFELFSSKQELLALIESKYSLSEEELIGVIAGLMRVDCFDEAIKLAAYLNKTFTSHNSGVIYLYAQALSLNPYLKDSDYWVLSQELKNNIDDLTESILALMNDYHGRDIRLFNIIVPLYVFTKENNIALRKLCLENLDFVEKVHKDFAQEFKSIFVEMPFDESNKIAVARKCKIDEVYRLKFVQENYSMNKVDISHFLLSKDVMAPHEVKVWALKGLEIIGGNSALESDLYKLMVLLVTEESDAISATISRILKSEDNLYETVSSITILLISDMLCEKELQYDACDIMEKYIHNMKNIWCSPFVIQYLINLYACARYLDFHNLEKNVIDTDKPDFIYYQLMSSYLYHSLPEIAEGTFTKIKNPKDIEFINLKLRTLNFLGKKIEIKDELNAFDYSTIESPSESLYNFLCTLAKLQRHDIIEIISIQLFLIDPESHSKFISDVGNNLMIGVRCDAPTFSYNINNCVCGVQYDDSGSKLTKLIIKNQKKQSQYFLSDTSQIAMNLEKATRGIQQRVGNKNITLEEKIPPYVAVYRISNTIRHESNDGSDQFQIIKLPNDPELMLESFKNNLPLNQERKTIEFSDEVFLGLQTNLLDKNDSIKGALQLLTQKKSKYLNFIDDGSLHDDSICTDVITVVYLCFTSLSHHFVNNGIAIHLIKEDIDSLQVWLDNISVASYVSMNTSADGKLLVTTPEQFSIIFRGFINNLKAILPLLVPLDLQITNSPKEFCVLNKIASKDYLKFLYALKKTSFSFLTIDTRAAHYANACFGTRLCNTNSIFLNAAQKVEFSSREEGIYLHSASEFPYSLLLNDFIHLSKSRTDPHGLFISSLINKYAGNFNDEIDINTLMISVFYNYLSKTVKPDLMGKVVLPQGNIYEVNPYGYNLDKVFYACCNAIVRAKGEASSEEKLAVFLVLFMYKNSSPKLHDFICKLASNFAFGHFMDIRKINALLPVITTSLKNALVSIDNNE